MVSNELGSPSSHRFDIVMRPETSQSDVFDNIKPMVDSALAGYNATIFAYGQTVRCTFHARVCA